MVKSSKIGGGGASGQKINPRAPLKQGSSFSSSKIAGKRDGSALKLDSKTPMATSGINYPYGTKKVMSRKG